MKQFGGKLTANWQNKYAASQNWRDGKFHNLVETGMNMNLGAIPGLIYRQLTEKGREPQHPLPVAPFDGGSFFREDNVSKFIWYGHSSLLARLNDTTILIDPMLGSDASPIAPFAVRRFSRNMLDIIDELPHIDLMLLSHDHYDHLDLASIEKLKEKVGYYYTALGVARHLIRWGIAGDKVEELDWWDMRRFHDINITFTPSRHFSGRGLGDRFKSLWGGWALKTNKENIYFSGDSGYGSHFNTIGQQLGPFDLGFMECGQYNQHWHEIHMFPEESVQAAKDAKVKLAVAVHWGAFALALHSWKDPIERFVKEAKMKNLSFGSPRIGEMFTINSIGDESWWAKLK